ncbi:hypothetical protein FisN_1Hh365 [Fistulifera solaris]|uniref:Uncharacterized protein n=1 Tax=Fistulifera solaris TaxID=1519565 RepID=A0A1Z5J9Z8_FISSO|nr:hypothetical protein FisN_1Hh365 [Fistulifera solaris]|eukprot:GAX10823.1 hypothetical protein FisN_1Hh365 [Fistulifera solaris]
MMKTPTKSRLSSSPLSTFSPNKLFGLTQQSPDPPGKGSDTRKSAANDSKVKLSPLKKVIASLDSRDCLGDSVRLLHGTLEEARIDNISDHLDQAVKDEFANDGQDENKDTAWLLNMFKSLEKKHSDDKSDWDKQLQKERKSKSSYKNKLTNAYKEKLTWLENQLQKVGETHCAVGKDFAHGEGKSLLESSSGESTGTASTSSNSQRGGKGKQNSSPPGDEKSSRSTILSPESVRRVQLLEKTLNDTLRQYESDRAVWVKALEEAAAVTQAGEQLSSYQEQLLSDLKKQLADEQKQHKKKWKEQNNVLKDLLTLTETQFQHERQEWERRASEYESTIEKQTQLAFEAHERLKLDLNEITKENISLQDEKSSLEETLAKIQEEKAVMSRQVKQLQKNLMETQSSRGAVVKVGRLRTLSPPRRTDWDDRLDRAMVERDLYKQEASQAAKNLEVERKKWEEHSEEALKAERRDAADRLEAERRTWEEKIEAKEKECVEIRNGWEAERQQWAEKQENTVKEWEEETRNQIEELQKIHAAELSEMQSSDDELAENYREALEKKNELILRLRRMEQQRGEEKGTWKLQLEGALSESRRAALTVQQLKKEIAEERRRRSEETELLRDELSHTRLLLSSKTIHDAQPSGITEHVMKLHEELEKAREGTECQLAMLRESHARDIHRLTSELEILESQNGALVVELKRQQKIRNEVNEEELTRKQSQENLSSEHCLAMQGKEEEINKLKSKLEDAEQLREKVEQDSIDLAEKLDVARRDAKQFEDKLKEVNEEHLKTTQEQTAHLQAVEEELCKANEEKQEIEQQVAAAKMENLKLVEQNQDLTVLIDNLKQKMETLVTVLSSDMEAVEGWHLKTKSMSPTEVLSALENCIQSLTSRHSLIKEGLELRVEMLSAENDKLRLGEKGSSVRLGNALEELRQDVISIRNIMEATRKTDQILEESSFDLLRANLEQIQNNLDDVAGEAALQTESLFEFRKLAENHFTGAGSNQDDKASVEFQHNMLSEMAILRDSLAKVIENQSEELQQPKRDLEKVKEELKEERMKRQKSEADIAIMNEQATAYTEELMHLQAENAKLEVLLQEAEAKANYALICQPQHSNEEDSLASEHVGFGRAASFSGDSTLLDEALALAQGLSDFVQGNNDNEHEVNVLEIMENLAGMIDKQDKSDNTSIPHLEINHPRGNESVFIQKTHDVSRQTMSTDDSKLSIFVEQLYGRCQLLERERLEMMELTLDLLESTRRSGKAEVEAALSVARRRIADDFKRMRDENSATREDLYHKICSGHD